MEALEIMVKFISLSLGSSWTRLCNYVIHD
jgi:hypothetical protein